MIAFFSFCYQLLTAAWLKKSAHWEKKRPEKALYDKEIQMFIKEVDGY